MPVRTVIVAFLVAAAVGAVAYLYLAPRAGLELTAGTALDPPRPLPAFALVDHHGNPFTRAAFERRWSLVFVGFTHCPDICPDTLFRLALLDQRLRDAGGELQPVFVSVDPERDTPEVLARYAGYFSPRIVATTGEKAQLDAFCEALGLAYIKVPGAGGEYTVDHSAALVLIDPKARVAAYFRPPLDLDRLAADLEPLLAKEGTPWP